MYAIRSYYGVIPVTGCQHAVRVDNLRDGMDDPAGFIDHPLRADDPGLPLISPACPPGAPLVMSVLEEQQIEA